MKALSLWQPWSSLVAAGAKKIETRSWLTSYRGLLAIHATKTFPAEAKALCFREPFRSALDPERKFGGLDLLALLPLGRIVAVARLADCLPTEMVRERLLTEGGIGDEDELAFGDYSPGRWAWLLEDVRPLPRPVPCAGARLLWDVPAAALAEIEKQMETP